MSPLSDCLVFPTHGDPNGLVVEEAMAAGLPVIVSDAAGDIHQRVPNGVAGYIFPVGSAAGLCDSMTKMAVDTVSAKAMADRALELVGSKSVEGYAEDFVAFVDDVVRRPARQGLASRLSRIIGRVVLSVARLQHWQSAPHVTR